MNEITKHAKVMYSAMARTENACPAPYDGYSWSGVSTLYADLPIVDSKREKHNCSERPKQDGCDVIQSEVKR